MKWPRGFESFVSKNYRIVRHLYGLNGILMVQRSARKSLKFESTPFGTYLGELIADSPRRPNLPFFRAAGWHLSIRQENYIFRVVPGCTRLLPAASDALAHLTWTFAEKNRGLFSVVTSLRCPRTNIAVTVSVRYLSRAQTSAENSWTAVNPYTAGPQAAVVVTARCQQRAPRSRGYKTADTGAGATAVVHVRDFWFVGFDISESCSESCSVPLIQTKHMHAARHSRQIFLVRKDRLGSAMMGGK